MFLQVDDTLPSIALNANESREILWGKTKLGFQVNKLFNLVSPNLSSSNLVKTKAGVVVLTTGVK